MELTLGQILLIAMVLVTLLAAIRVTTTRSVVHAAFWLFPAFAGIAGIYLYLGAHFLAAIQVLIYIGAILVLIVFAVTLTRNSMDKDDAQTNRFAVPVAVAALLLLVALGGALLKGMTDRVLVSAIDGITIAPGVPVTGIPALGMTLLQQYLVAFEITSVLLLAAMVGAIVLARREPREEGECTEADVPCNVTTETSEAPEVPTHA